MAVKAQFRIFAGSAPTPLIWIGLVLALVLVALLVFAPIEPTILLIALVGILLLPVFLLRPQWGFLALLFIRPLVDIVGNSVTVTVLNRFTINLAGMIGIFVGVWGVLYLLSQRAKPWRLAAWVFLALLVLWGGASLAYSRFPSDSIAEIVRAGDYAVIFALGMVFLRTRQDFDHFVHVVFASAVIPLVVAAQQLVLQTGLSDEARANRLFGTFAHPNFLAYFLAVVILLLVAHIKAQPAVRQRIWPWALLLASSAGLLLTYTRGALLIVMGGLILFALLLYGQRAIQWGLTLALGIVVLVGLLFLIERTTHLGLSDITLVQRFTNLTSNDVSTNSLAFRFSLWKQMLPIVEERLVLGHGSGTFRKLATTEANIALDAHNDYLKMAGELGLVGVVLFVGFLFASWLASLLIFLRSDSVHRVYAAALLALLSGLIAMSFFDNIYQSTALYWILLASIAGLPALATQSRK